MHGYEHVADPGQVGIIMMWHAVLSSQPHNFRQQITAPNIATLNNRDYVFAEVAGDDDSKQGGFRIRPGNPPSTLNSLTTYT